MTTPNPDIKNLYTIEILSFDKKAFTIKLSIVSNKLEIFISNDSSLSLSYKLSFSIDDFHKLNKFFKQFDSVEEILFFIIGIEKLEERINIITEDKFVKLIISLPNISKGSLYNNIEIMIPNIEVKESDLIIKLCEKVEKINILELKFNYLFTILGKKETDFDSYVEVRFNIHKFIKNLDSKIITIDDLILPSLGIKKILNKKIKGIIYCIEQQEMVILLNFIINAMEN